MSKALRDNMNELLGLLDNEGYPFKAGYLHTFLKSLHHELNLTPEQKQLFADTIARRIAWYHHARTPREGME